MISHFVDTSYLIALENGDDQYHEVASEHWSVLARSSSLSLVTSSYLFVEVVTLLNNHRLHTKAVEVGKNLLGSRVFDVVHVDEDLFYEAWAHFQKHKDKTYSLTDCASFVLMKRLGITEALTFDKHFVQAGFTKLPK